MTFAFDANDLEQIVARYGLEQVIAGAFRHRLGKSFPGAVDGHVNHLRPGVHCLGDVKQRQAVKPLRGEGAERGRATAYFVEDFSSW